MRSERLNDLLDAILKRYSLSFSVKAFGGESVEEDDLMLVFGLTQAIKSENRQYWGRELGMCWQLLVTELCPQTCDNFGGPIREGLDELCDFVIENDAIDTKCRIGSGDSGTLKKFKRYGARLQERGFRPVLLIVRTDNLPAAITACTKGGWVVLSGNDTYEYLRTITQFDLRSWLQARRNCYIFKSLTET